MSWGFRRRQPSGVTFWAAEAKEYEYGEDFYGPGGVLKGARNGLAIAGD